MRNYRPTPRRNRSYENVASLTTAVANILNRYGVEYEYSTDIDGYSKDPDTTLELIAGVLCGDGVLRDCVIEVFSKNDITLDWLDNDARKPRGLYKGSLSSLENLLDTVVNSDLSTRRRR